MTTNLQDPTIVDPEEARRQATLLEVFGTRFDKEKFQSATIVFKEVMLRTPASARFYNRDFGYIGTQTLIESHYREWRGFNQEALDAFVEIVSTKLSKINEFVRNNANRLEKLLHDAGIEIDNAAFARPVVVYAPVITYSANEYLKLLQAFDKISLLAGTCSIEGLIDNSQKAQLELTVKKMIRQLRTIVQQQSEKLFKIANEIKKAQGNTTAAQDDLQKYHESLNQDSARSLTEDGEHDGLDAGDSGEADLGMADTGTPKRTRSKKADPAKGEATVDNTTNAQSLLATEPEAT